MLGVGRSGRKNSALYYLGDLPKKYLTWPRTTTSKLYLFMLLDPEQLI